MTVSWTVTNQGTGAGAIGSWVDAVVASPNTVLGDGDDLFTGGAKAESVKDGNGTDTVKLGAGKDTYIATGHSGTDGSDVVDGGLGADKCVRTGVTTIERDGSNFREFKLSHETIAERVGKSRVAVTNTLRLLEASAPVKQALVDGRITEGHARALLALTSAKAQENLLNQVVNLDLSVRQTEALASKLSGKKPSGKRRTSSSADVTDLERRLRSSLGTKVTLKHGKKGGTVTIYYYSDEELDSLLEKLT